MLCLGMLLVPWIVPMIQIIMWCSMLRLIHMHMSPATVPHDTHVKDYCIAAAVAVIVIVVVVMLCCMW